MHHPRGLVAARTSAPSPTSSGTRSGTPGCGSTTASAPSPSAGPSPSDDLSAAVGLLDLTHVAGDADVVNAARSTVAHDWRANARTRLGEMQESVVQRHARQGDLAHLIEPDLKEAHGGLRDMSVLRRPHGRLAHRPARTARSTRPTSASSTCATPIHVVTGRGRDRLTRDDHDACAALLGYTDADDLLTDLSTSARTIAYAVDGTLRRAMQSQRARTLRVGPRRPQLAPLGYGLYRARRRGGPRPVGRPVVRPAHPAARRRRGRAQRHTPRRRRR